MATNRKNRNFAIPAAAPAMPVKPNNAAIIAITKKIAAHLNMRVSPPSVYLIFGTLLRLWERYLFGEAKSLGSCARRDSAKIPLGFSMRPAMLPSEGVVSFSY